MSNTPSINQYCFVLWRRKVVRADLIVLIREGYDNLFAESRIGMSITQKGRRKRIRI